MKNNKGITLILVIMTVILLTIIMGLILTNGLRTWNSSKIIKFKTNMQIIQKKVDIIIEQHANYTLLGETLTAAQKTKLNDILNSEGGYYIQSEDVDSNALRYFSEESLKRDFNLEGIQDEFIINFSNREIISLKGIEKDGIIYYTLRGLD